MLIVITTILVILAFGLFIAIAVMDDTDNGGVVILFIIVIIVLFGITHYSGIKEGQILYIQGEHFIEPYFIYKDSVIIDTLYIEVE